ncbi:MAG: radical SAM/SPASM domain-containing protein [Planctomycetota bacterium]
MPPIQLLPRLRKQLRRARQPYQQRVREREIAERRLALSTGPAHVSLELTARCNLECFHCRRFHVREEYSDVRGVFGAKAVDNVVGDSGYLTPEVFERCLDLVRDTTTVELAGYGEPMMNPHFFDYVAALKGRGLHCNTITNGTLLTEGNVKKLVDHRFDLISVSIDGYEKETLKLVRGLDRDELFDGLERLRREKERRGLGRGDAPRLSVSFCMARFNIRELPDLVRHLERLGLESFYTQILETVNADDVLGKHLIHTDPKIREEAVAICDDVRRFCEEHGIRHDLRPIPHGGNGDEPEGVSLDDALAALRDDVNARMPEKRVYLPVKEIEAEREAAAKAYREARGVHRPGVLPEVETAKHTDLSAEACAENERCLDFFRYAFVAWSGKVLSCCFERYPVGDLNVQTADEVWNGEEYRRLRRSYFEQGIRSVCDGCSKILA